MNEKITIEDMKEFDPLVYQSLKWIFENNDIIDDFFVDRNDKPLITNGRNIKLIDENKKEYIKLMLKHMFLGSNTKLFEYMVNGFKKTVDENKLKNYDAQKLRDNINGEQYIDFSNMMMNLKESFI